MKELEIIDRLARIETKLDMYHTSICEVKENQRWLWRTIIGSLIGSLFAIAVTVFTR
jgi:hypothetical protein